MNPFKRSEESYKWVEENVQGPVCVIVANARILLNPWCRGDMRLIQTRHFGVWS